jgi:hypothetical protein
VGGQRKIRGYMDMPVPGVIGDACTDLDQTQVENEHPHYRDLPEYPLKDI